MTSESTSFDPSRDSEESLPAEPAQEPVEAPAAPPPPVAKPAAEEPIIMLDPDYAAPPELSRLSAAETIDPVASGSILHGNRPDAEAVRVQISQEALEQIRLHSESDMRTELGGFLLGIPYDEDGQIVVDVRAALPAHSNDHGPIHFTFTADSWAMMHEERETMYPHLQVVGWFHTHPDLGVFYSGDDVVVHTVGFSLPWHVGLVVDPVRRKVGWFGWHGEGSHKELGKLAGYYEMTNLQPTAITPWKIAERSAVWASYTEGELAQGDSSGYGYTYGDQNSSARRTMEGLGAFIGLLGIMMALLVWLLGYVPVRRQLNAMQETTAAMVAAEYASAEAQGLASCASQDLRFLAPLPGDWVPAGSTIGLYGQADVAVADGYRLLVTSYGPISNRSREGGTISQPAVTGKLFDLDVPDLPYGSALQLELLPTSDTPTATACSITLYVGNP
ncbi:MAG: Mov34/MPN/PAD-1 family protein [Anaerolineales bacterium]|nr:Mov34/MPN/PAD-1 family protein [Anaerolineales bacterium]MCB0011028.1 Mov34/MPN/PAD-1 family protein [Anaerolineales bacterium]MCB8961117.1 Mov34/MPN/PAD-1 family protein [Ardenticatenales bacterium]